MNKFETALLQTLSSIDESLKALAVRPQASAASPKKPKKPAKAEANGALPKVAAANPPKPEVKKGKG